MTCRSGRIARGSMLRVLRWRLAGRPATAQLATPPHAAHGRSRTWGTPSRLPSRWMLREVGRSVRRLVWAARPYSSGYIAVCCVCALLSSTGSVPLRQALIAMLVAPVLLLGLCALNDYTHRHADTRSQRRTVSDALLPIGVSATLLATALAACGGPTVLVGLAGSAALGYLYGRVKNVPLGSNLVRGLATVPLLIGWAATGDLTTTAWQLAGAIVCLDAAGNLLGDVRDVAVDTRAGTRTLAVWSVGFARVASIALVLGALVIVPLPLRVAALAAVPAVLLCLGSALRTHGYFLLFKYAVVGYVGVTLAQTPEALMVVVILASLAVPSAFAYAHVHHWGRPHNSDLSRGPGSPRESRTAPDSEPRDQATTEARREPRW